MTLESSSRRHVLRIAAGGALSAATGVALASVSPSAAAPAGGSKKVVPFAHDLRRGAAATKVTIVEFSDFQCPFCKRSEPTVKGVLDKYGKDVSLVWMNQPLPFHDHAMDAATAFQAAARQGVTAGCSTSAGQAGLAPEQYSATSQAPAVGRQTAVFGL